MISKLFQHKNQKTAKKQFYKAIETAESVCIWGAAGKGVLVLSEFSDELLEKIAQSLFTLNLNEQSQVIKSPIAYHIVVLKTIKPARQLKLEESKDDIIKTISNSDVSNYMIDLENQISQDILDNFNLIEIAKKNDLKLSTIKDITKDFNKFDLPYKIIRGKKPKTNPIP